MVIEMNEVDVAFLGSTGAPLWLPLRAESPMNGTRGRGATGSLAPRNGAAAPADIELEIAWIEVVEAIDGILL